MSPRRSHARRRGRWSISHRLFAARPKLASAAAAGLVVGGAVAGLGHHPATSFIAGWDTFCLVFLGLVAIIALPKTPADIRVRAAAEDEGQAIILLLVTAAVLVSLAAIASQLVLAKSQHGLLRALYVGTAVATIAASWLVTQVVLALHYAHDYYGADAATGKDRGGLVFPGRQAPDYWDFIHFSIVIGVAAQTADIAIADRRLRRLATWHSLMAFAFNALIVALAINLVAGLF